MAFQGNFVITQTSASTIVFTDNSTGSDNTITSRRITLTQYNGTTLVPTGTTTSYIVWPIADTTITLSGILAQDVALSIRVEWLAPSPDPDGTYTVERTYDFTWYDEAFYYGLTQQLAAQPNIINDTVFFGNYLKLRVLIDSANQAITFGADVYNSQNCLNMAQQFVDNESFYY